jgi:hypothetical protein
MAKDTKQLAGGFETENTGGLLTGFLAEEDEFDRPSLWRLGSWGAGSVGAVIVALLASQSSIGWRREQIAAADLARQAQQLQAAARESQSETRRLVSAVDTLNSDRDRLYSRVTVLEQGLDSVTGSIARQNAAAASPQAAVTPATTAEPPSASQSPAPAPVVSPVATTAAPAPEKARPSAAAMEPAPATVASVAQATTNTPPATPPPLMASKSMLAPPDTPAAKLIEPEAPAKTVTAAPMPEVVASVASAEDAQPDDPSAAPKLAVRRTEFGVDVGGANSIGGLRALWRGLLKSKSNAPLMTLRPIIVVKENNNGLGMQLRLVAGPLNDAGTAAKICATLIENQRPCETTLFEGQRLTIKADDPPAAAKPAPRRRAPAKRAAVEEPPKKPETSSTVSSTVSSLFSKRSQ